MTIKPRLQRIQKGITLVEILMVVVIIAILATLSFPLFGFLREKARDVSCKASLRVLWVGANNYLMDNDYVWPQMLNEPDLSESEEPLWKWWYETLKPYGVSKHHWICASENASAEQKYSATSEYYGSYIPTKFEATRNVAFHWPQPWFIERGEFHGPGHGPNIVMPDGTVQQGPAVMNQR